MECVRSVSVGPEEAAGALQKSSLIAVGLVSVMSVKVSCKYQCKPDLATGIPSYYAFG